MNLDIANLMTWTEATENSEKKSNNLFYKKGLREWLELFFIMNYVKSNSKDAQSLKRPSQICLKEDCKLS